MTPTRYRWDNYCLRKTPTQWYTFRSWSQLARTFRGLTHGEAIRVEYDNGQQFVFRLKPGHHQPHPNITA